MTRRQQITKPELKMRVFHEKIYKGKEPMKIVGIREDEVELEGDWSGGTHAVCQKDWMPLEGCFQIIKVCEQNNKPNGCPLPNAHCGYPFCEPIVNWEEL